MDTEREPVSGSEEGWGSERGGDGHPLARYKRPALVLLSLFLVWQLYGMLFGEGSPRALKYLHEDTFLVARVDLDAVMDGDLFEWITERRGLEEGWEQAVEEMEEGFGVRPEDLRSLTLALSVRSKSWLFDPEVMLFLETRKELDLERIGEEIEGFWVATDDDGGDGANARLRFECEREGSYRVRVSALDGGELEGRLMGAIGREKVDSPLSGTYPRPGEGTGGVGSFGPYQVKAGDVVDVYTRCSGDSYLSLQRVPPAGDELEGVYSVGDAVITRLGSRLYLMCDGRDPALAVRAREGSELDKSMQRLLDDVDWSAEASLAFDISALPTELLEEGIGEGLRELGKSTRDARLMRDIEGLIGTVDLKSDSMRYKFDVLCEDKEVAEDLLDGLEDALEAVEDLPGLPRAVDDFIESFSLRARGKSVAVEATVTEEMLKDFFGLMGMGGDAPDAPGFIYTLK
jgi:hypothetical protein